MAAACLALGFLLPRALVRPGMATLLLYLLMALQSILMFLVPGVLLQYANTGNKPSLAGSLRKASPMESGLTMLAAVCFVLVGSLIGSIFYLQLEAMGLKPVLPDSLVPKGPGELVLSLIVVGLLTAVCEELFFRKALPELLEKRLLRGWATAISSLVFAGLHLNLVAFPTLMLFALYQHRLVKRFHSLTLPIVFHAMYNIAILIINFSGAQQTLPMILLSTFVFVLCTRILLKEERHEPEQPKP